MNFIAPWKEIRFRFNSPTFWRINLLATLNGMFFASLAVSIAGSLALIISERIGTGTVNNLTLLQLLTVPLIFFLFYVFYLCIRFRFVIIRTIAFFIPVCLCNLFLNTNRWATIVYYTLLILLLMAYPQLLIENLIEFLLYVGIECEFLIIPAIIFCIPVCLCNLFLNSNRWGTIVYYTLFTLLIFSLISFSPSWDLRAAVQIVAFSICFGTALGYNLWKHCFLYYTDLGDDDRELLPIIPSWEICRPIVKVLKNLLVVVLIASVGLLLMMIRNWRT